MTSSLQVPAALVLRDLALEWGCALYDSVSGPLVWTQGPRPTEVHRRLQAQGLTAALCIGDLARAQPLSFRPQGTLAPATWASMVHKTEGLSSLYTAVAVLTRAEDKAIRHLALEVWCQLFHGPWSLPALAADPAWLKLSALLGVEWFRLTLGSIPDREGQERALRMLRLSHERIDGPTIHWLTTNHIEIRATPSSSQEDSEVESEVLYTEVPEEPHLPAHMTQNVLLFALSRMEHHWDLYQAVLDGIERGVRWRGPDSPLEGQLWNAHRACVSHLTFLLQGLTERMAASSDSPRGVRHCIKLGEKLLEQAPDPACTPSWPPQYHLCPFPDTLEP